MHLFTIAAILVCGLGLTLSMASPGAMNLRDAMLRLSLTLPTAGSATVTSAASIDLGITTQDAFQPSNMEFLITAPALSTAQLPDTKAISYSIVLSASANLSTPTVFQVAVLTQTGAGGAGAQAATYRTRLPSVLPAGMRYVGFTATNSAAGAGDASGATAILEVVV